MCQLITHYRPQDVCVDQVTRHILNCDYIFFKKKLKSRIIKILCRIQIYIRILSIHANVNFAFLYSNFRIVLAPSLLSVKLELIQTFFFHFQKWQDVHNREVNRDYWESLQKRAKFFPFRSEFLWSFKISCLHLINS